MNPAIADYFGAIGKVVLDRYEVVRTAGEGGMAAVYEGTDRRLSRRVAIKFLKVQQLQDVPSAVARFRREAEILAQLDHPNIVRVHDIGEFSDTPVLVMEWLEGESLAERLQRTGLMDWRTALRYLTPIARALAAAHAQGIVHRDIKPPNIYVRRDDEVRLLDFGVARIYGLTEAVPQETTNARIRRITKTGLVLGTPHYVSPEQWRAEELDGRSDVYAVGVTLYLAMTGIALWETDNPMAVIQFVGLEEPRDIASRVPSIPAHVADLVRKCLAKDRRHRLTAAELVTYCEQCIGSGDGPLLSNATAPTVTVRAPTANHPTAPMRSGAAPLDPDERQAKPSPTDALRDFIAAPALPPVASERTPRSSRASMIAIVVLAVVALGGVAIGVLGLTRRSVDRVEAVAQPAATPPTVAAPAPTPAPAPAAPPTTPTESAKLVQPEAPAKRKQRVRHAQPATKAPHGEQIPKFGEE